MLEVADEVRIAGWAYDSRRDECLVELLLDGRPFVTVRANQARPDVEARYGRPNSGFNFTIGRSLAAAIPAGSLVTARFLESAKPLDSAPDLRIGSGDENRLATMLDHGWAVSPKSGDLYQPIGSDESWAAAIGNVYGLVRAQFLKELDRELFVAYGSLLGLAREGAFLAHDDDFDAGFLSRATDVAGMAHDLLSVAAQMREVGMTVEVFDIGSMHVTIPGLPVKLDVFVFGLVDDNLTAYQVRSPMAPAAVEPTSEFTLAGVSYAAPADVDAVLTATYGNWRIPDPYFQWGTDPAKETAMDNLAAEIRRQRESQ